MTIKALVFDFGNVVGFFDHGRTTRRLAPHARLAHDELHHLLYTSPLAERYERGALSTPEFRSAVRQIASLDCPDDHFDDAYGDIFWANPELDVLLKELAERYPLVLLSNTNELHARKFRVQFAATLGLFRHRLLSFEVGLRKPSAEIYAHALERAGCAAREVLFVDDLPANVEGARAAGWNGVVYTNVDELRRSFAACGLAIRNR